MKRRRRLSFLSILGALILSLVAVVTASADQPIFSQEHIVEDGTYELCEQEMLVHEEYDWRATGWDDRWIEFYLKRWTTFTNPDNGNKLTLHGSHLDRGYWISDDKTILFMNGLQEFGTLPGHGVVWGYAGTIKWSVTSCREDNGEWVCDYELVHWGGMGFSDEETVCNYLLNGE
jgi:hypothetical protein